MLFAALFLAAGAAMLGITYGLVASLPVKVPKPTPAQAKLERACKLGKAELGPVRISQCSQAFSAVGAQSAADEQRAQTLGHLLAYSLAALGAMTARRADRLPVIDAAGNAAGVIVLADLVR